MATKLLLIEDVFNLGRSGDVVSVKPGYARNFLLPQGFAVVADKRALQMQAKLQEERKVKAAHDLKESQELAKQMEGMTLSTTVKVDQEGHMYGSVSALDIVRMLEEDQKIQVEKNSVMLKHPIKAVGVHTIELKLKEGVVASFVLKVIPEGGLIENEAAPTDKQEK